MARTVVAAPMSMWRWLGLLGLVLTAMVIASAQAGPDRWASALVWAERHDAEFSPLGEAQVADLCAAAKLAASVPNFGLLREAVDRRPEAGRLGEVERSAAVGALCRALRPAIAAIERAVAPAARDEAARRLRPRRGGPALEHAVLQLDHGLDALLVGALGGSHHDLATVLLCGAEMLRARPLLARMFAVVVVDRALATAEAMVERGTPPSGEEWLAALAAAEAGLAVAADAPAWMVRSWVEWAEVDAIDAGELTVQTRLGAWRHGFSGQAAARDLVAAVVAQVQAFERSTPPGEAWPARQARLLALEAEDASVGGLRMQSMLRGLALQEQQIRTQLDRVRGERRRLLAAAGR